MSSTLKMLPTTAAASSVLLTKFPDTIGKRLCRKITHLQPSLSLTLLSLRPKPCRRMPSLGALRSFGTAPMSLAKARQVLGVEQGVTEVELKSAFRARALEFHPDRNEEEGAQTKFLESRLAFEALLPTLGGTFPRSGGFKSSNTASSSSSAHPFWRPTSSAWQTWSGEANSSAYAGWRQRPSTPWGENEHPRDWQEREANERKKKHREQMRADAEKAEKWAREEAVKLGIKRGTLLVAKPDTRGFFTMSVVLLMEIDETSARGIVINGGPGGRTGLQDHAVFHSCRHMATEGDDPLVEGVELFVEEYLQKYQAHDLAQELAEMEEPLARTQGYTWWPLEQLVRDIKAGHWKTASWGSEGARWWLKVRSKLTTRTLWRRALKQAEEQEAKRAM